MIANRPHRRRPALGLALTLASLTALAPGAARADLMRYQYSGMVTSADANAPMAAGTRFTGVIAYDPSEAPVNYGTTAGTQFGSVMGQGKPDADELSLTVGGMPVYSQVGGLAINASPGLNGTTNVAFSSANFAANPGTTMAILLSGGAASAYPAGMPPAAVKLGDFASAQIFVGSQDGGAGYSFRGMIDGVAALPTPEPSTAALLVAAGAAVAWRRGRRAARD